MRFVLPDGYAVETDQALSWNGFAAPTLTTYQAALLEMHLEDLDAANPSGAPSEPYRCSWRDGHLARPWLADGLAWIPEEVAGG